MSIPQYNPNYGSYYYHTQPSAPPMEEVFKNSEPASADSAESANNQGTSTSATQENSNIHSYNSVPYTPFTPPIKVKDVPYTPFTPPSKVSRPANEAADAVKKAEVRRDKEELDSDVISQTWNIGTSILSGMASFTFSALKFGGSSVVDFVNSQMQTPPEVLEKDIRKCTSELFKKWHEMKSLNKNSSDNHKNTVFKIISNVEKMPISKYNQSKLILNHLEKHTKHYEMKINEANQNFTKAIREIKKNLP